MTRATGTTWKSLCILAISLMSLGARGQHAVQTGGLRAGVAVGQSGDPRVEAKRAEILAVLAKLDFYAQKSAYRGRKLPEGQAEVILNLAYDAEDEHALTLKLLGLLYELRTGVPAERVPVASGVPQPNGKESDEALFSVLRHCYTVSQGGTVDFTFQLVKNIPPVPDFHHPKSSRRRYLIDDSSDCRAFQAAFLRRAALGKNQFVSDDPILDHAAGVLTPSDAATHALFDAGLALAPRGLSPEDAAKALARLEQKAEKDVDVEKNVIAPAVDKFVDAMLADLNESLSRAKDDASKRLIRRAIERAQFLGDDLRDPKKRRYLQPVIEPKDDKTYGVRFVPTALLAKLQHAQSLAAGVNVNIGGEPRRPNYAGRSFKFPPPTDAEGSIGFFLTFGASEPSSLVSVTHLPEAPLQSSDGIIVDIASVGTTLIARQTVKQVAKELFKETVKAGAGIAKEAVTDGVKRSVPDILSGNADFSVLLDNVSSSARDAASRKVESIPYSSRYGKVVKELQEGIRASPPAPLESFTAASAPERHASRTASVSVESPAARNLALLRVLDELPPGTDAWALPWLRRPDSHLLPLAREDARFLSVVDDLMDDEGKDLKRLEGKLDAIVEYIERTGEHETPPRDIRFAGRFFREAAEVMRARRGAADPVAREVERMADMIDAYVELQGPAGLQAASGAEAAKIAKKREHAFTVMRALVEYGATGSKEPELRTGLSKTLLSLHPDPQNSHGLQRAMEKVLADRPEAIPPLRTAFEHRRLTARRSLTPGKITQSFANEALPHIQSLLKHEPGTPEFRREFYRLMDFGKANGISSSDTWGYLIQNDNFGIKPAQWQALPVLYDEYRLHELLLDPKRATEMFGPNGVAIGKKLATDEAAFAAFAPRFRELVKGYVDAEDRAAFLARATPLLEILDRVGGREAVAGFRIDPALDFHHQSASSKQLKARFLDEARHEYLAGLDRDRVKLAVKKLAEGGDAAVDALGKAKATVGTGVKDLAARVGSLEPDLSQALSRAAKAEAEKRALALRKLGEGKDAAVDAFGKLRTSADAGLKDLGARLGSLEPDLSRLLSRAAKGEADRQAHAALVAERDAFQEKLATARKDLDARRLEADAALKRIEALRATQPWACGCALNSRTGSCDIYRLKNREAVVLSIWGARDDATCQSYCTQLRSRVESECAGKGPSEAELEEARALEAARVRQLAEVERLEVKVRVLGDGLQKLDGRLALSGLAGNFPPPAVTGPTPVPKPPPPPATPPDDRPHGKVTIEYFAHRPDVSAKLESLGRPKSELRVGDEELFRLSFTGWFQELRQDFQGNQFYVQVYKTVQVDRRFTAGKLYPARVDSFGNITVSDP